MFLECHSASAHRPCLERESSHVLSPWVTALQVPLQMQRLEGKAGPPSAFLLALEWILCPSRPSGPWMATRAPVLSTVGGGPGQAWDGG